MLTVENEDIKKAVNGEPVFIKADTDDVVILSKSEYDIMLRAKRNQEYLDMLDESIAQAEAGNFVMKTIEELEAMAEE